MPLLTHVLQVSRWHSWKKALINSKPMQGWEFYSNGMVKADGSVEICRADEMRGSLVQRLTPNSSCEWPNGWNGCWMAGHSCLTRAEAPPSLPPSTSTCQFPLNGCWEKGSRLSGTIKSLGVHHLSARRLEPASFSASCQFVSDFPESWQVGDSCSKV